jgi:type VI secretion system protein ImpM
VDVGLYGKLPSHGDFLRRRASDGFVSVWDAWLQECMTASRSAMGDRWLEVYLTSPVWRFSGAGGACGASPIIGLMAPSVDRVGRYFPLAIVAELPPFVGPVAAVRAAGSFFASAERLMLETLESEHIDFEEFDERVAQLADLLGTVNIPPPVALDHTAGAILEQNGQAWQLPIASADDLTTAFEQLLSSRLARLYDPLMVWWTEGSSMVEPSCLIHRGLPEPDAFTALLDGLWQQNNWRPVPAQMDRNAGALSFAEPALDYRSAAASDVGRVRQVNEDSFLERSEFGLWTVADGLGGHSHGEHASRMVCDAFADFTPGRSFDDTIAAARARMQEVNDELLLGSARSLLGDRSLSTVVTLLVRGAQCAVLWAGDSRAYRWRSGRLEQLTRDHSVAAEGGRDASQGDSHAVTRALGAHISLSLDLIRDQVQADDRFLLCSDGLSRALPDVQICALMADPDIRASVDALVDATLQAGAPDNVTAIIVKACAVIP